MSREQAPITHTRALIEFAEEISKPADEVTAVDIINSYSDEDLLPSRPIPYDYYIELGLDVREFYLRERPVAETRRLAEIGRKILENPESRFQSQSRTQRCISAGKRLLNRVNL